MYMLFDAAHIPGAWQARCTRVLLGCFIGSLLLHVAALMLLPELKPGAPATPARPFEVALVSVEPPRPVAPVPPESKRVIPARKPAAPQPERKREPASSGQTPVPPPLSRPAVSPAAEVTVNTIPVEAPVSAAKPPDKPTPSREAARPATPFGFSAEYLRNPAPRYPLIARRNGEQGTVTLRVLVTRDGVPAQVSIERSSGSSHLDGAALEAVRTWRFVPARRGSDAVEAWVLVPVVFRLDGVS